MSLVSNSSSFPLSVFKSVIMLNNFFLLMCRGSFFSITVSVYLQVCHFSLIGMRSHLMLLQIEMAV